MTSLFDNTTIPLLEQVVNFSQARHNVLAGNIANLDTPGYQVQDLSPVVFQARLKQALTEQNRPDALSWGNAPVSGNAAGPFAHKLESASKDVQGLLRHDDSNVGIEQQVAEMAKNHMQHNLALAIMTSQFRLLQSAVSERV